MIRQATFLRQLDGWRTDARLDPPYYQYDHVILSANGDPETYIFPADAEGQQLSRTEMPGSQKGHMDHTRVLHDLGYTVIGMDDVVPKEPYFPNGGTGNPYDPILDEMGYEPDDAWRFLYGEEEQ